MAYTILESIEKSPNNWIIKYKLNDDISGIVYLDKNPTQSELDLIVQNSIDEQAAYIAEEENMKKALEDANADQN